MNDGEKLVWAAVFAQRYSAMILESSPPKHLRDCAVYAAAHASRAVTALRAAQVHLDDGTDGVSHTLAHIEIMLETVR